MDIERAKKKKKEWQKVPIMTDFFNGKEPEFTEEAKEKMCKLYPKEAKKGQFDKLYEYYKRQLVNIYPLT